MPGNWQTTFGGESVKPAVVQYEALNFSVNTVLVWPTESYPGVPYVASQINASASAGGLYLQMPDATLGATGVATCISNTGANNFDIHDSTGGLIGTIATGTSWILTLTDNSTAAGAWLLTQLGALTSQAQAAALAGAGLEAVGARLRVKVPSTSLAVNTLLDSTYRANCVVWTAAGVGTLTLDATASLVPGWWAIVTNEGGGDVTVATTGGETINGAASINLAAKDASGNVYSTYIVADNGKFHATAMTPNIIAVAHGGTGASTAGQALINLGGSTVGISIFEAPNVAAILTILGLKASAFTENNSHGAVTVPIDGAGTAYHCTNNTSFTLPQTIQVDDSFYIAIDAGGFTATLVPDIADSIGGLPAGTNFVMPPGTSALLITDGTANWWPLFFSSQGGIPWATAAGTADVITAAYSPQVAALTDGMLLGFSATGPNLTATPTFSPDSQTAHTIKKFGNAPLLPGDIPKAGADCMLRYHSSGTYWQLLNPAKSATPWAAAGGSASAIIATYNPANGALYDGLLLSWRAAHTNTTAAPTFNPDGLGANTITKSGGQALANGDISINGEYVVQYDLANTRWELLNPSFAFNPQAPIILKTGSLGTGTANVLAFDATPYSQYSRFEIQIENLTVSGNAILMSKFSQDGGSSYLAANYTWQWTQMWAAAGANGAAAARVELSPSIGTPRFVTLYVSGLNTVSTPFIWGTVSNGAYYAEGFNSAGSCNAVLLLLSANTVTGGTYRVIGFA